MIKRVIVNLKSHFRRRANETSLLGVSFGLAIFISSFTTPLSALEISYTGCLTEKAGKPVDGPINIVLHRNGLFPEVMFIGVPGKLGLVGRQPMNLT